MPPNTALIHQGTDFTRPLKVCSGICTKSSAAAPATCEVGPPWNGLICPAHPTDGQIDQDLGIWIWRLSCNSSEKTLTCSLHVSLQLWCCKCHHHHHHHQCHNFLSQTLVSICSIFTSLLSNRFRHTEKQKWLNEAYRISGRCVSMLHCIPQRIHLSSLVWSIPVCPLACLIAGLSQINRMDFSKTRSRHSLFITFVETMSSGVFAFFFTISLFSQCRI